MRKHKRLISMYTPLKCFTVETVDTNGSIEHEIEINVDQLRTQTVDGKVKVILYADNEGNWQVCNNPFRSGAL